MDNTLISLSNITKEFYGKTLFKNVSFAINEFDKIALIGPNGAGKSSLLKIIAGVYEAEDGSVKKQENLKISYLEQNTRFKEKTCKEVLLNELKKETNFLSNEDVIIKKHLSSIGLSEDDEIQSLSGGQRKKLALVKAMILKPQIILLDEPTNHLDFEGIEYLENYLLSPKTTFVLTTHDRTLLEKCAKRIIEIDSCYEDRYFVINDGVYKFLEQKEIYLQSLENKKDAIKSVLRKENEWLSRMPKARGTKAKYRIEKAYALQDELKDTQKLLNKNLIDFEIQSSDRKTKELIKIKNLNFSYDKKPIVKNFSCIIRKNDTIGVLGNNGIGKSTLLKLISKEIKAQSGNVFHADNLKLKYFSQLREEISLDTLLKDALSPKSDSVYYKNQNIHIIPWAKRFSFSEAQLNEPLSTLSGGELARVYISRIITEEADFLILDEPTNDLDIQTIECLEDAILKFNGACLIVSHDRKLLENLCNFCIGFVDNEGTILPFADYNQWHEFLKKKEKQEKIDNKKEEKIKANNENNNLKKLSYNEKKELETIESVILSEEEKLEILKENLGKDDVVTNHEKLMEISKNIETLQEKIDALYARWEELEERSKIK